MKTAVSLLALLVIMAFAARVTAQAPGLAPGKVHPTARKNFEAMHPGQKVIWHHGDKGRYEACFFVDGIRNIDVFAGDGTLLQHKRNLLRSQTPAPVVKAVETSSPGAEWVEVYNVETAAGNRFIEVTYVAGGIEYKGNYHSEGRFLSGEKRSAQKTVAGN